MTKYKKFIDDKVKIIAGKGGFVLDVGGGSPFTKWLKKYRSHFLGCKFQTMDNDNQTGADIIGDIHKIPIEDESVDSVLCHCVLEHVDNPILAVKEMRRILKKGGSLFVQLPSIYPYHARAGHYPDMWRFFDDTIKVLFKDFSTVEVVKRGGYFLALSFFVPLQHKIRFILDPLADFLDFLFKTSRRTTTAGYYVYLVK